MARSAPYGGRSLCPCSAQSSTSSRPTSVACSTRSPGATTSPTTSCRSARTASGARPVIAAVDPQPGSGSSTSLPAPVRRASPSPTAARRVVPCDFSLGMLQVGKKAKPHLPFTAGDGTRLPASPTTPSTRSRSRSACATSSTPSAGLRELRRVTQPGRSAGRLRVQPPDLGAVPHRLPRVPDEGAAPDRARRLLGPRTPTSTSPSRSGPGPTSAASPTMIAGAGWDAPRGGATSPGGIVALHPRALADVGEFRSADATEPRNQTCLDPDVGRIRHSPKSPGQRGFPGPSTSIRAARRPLGAPPHPEWLTVFRAA